MPVQSYYNRADLLGGSTLGSIADTKVSVPTVDVGIPQLAMHSSTELVAARDVDNLAAIIRELYSSHLVHTDDGIRLVK
jgi:aspartyl aminopeptidase